MSEVPRSDLGSDDFDLPWKLLAYYNQAGSRLLGEDGDASTAAPAEPSARVSP